MSNFLTIDPGMTTAWAHWKLKTLPEVGQFKIDPKCHKTMQTKFEYLWYEFDLIIKIKKPHMVYIEGVEFYQFSHKSSISARTGDLFTLAYLIGGYCNICDNWNIQYRLVPFREWGGQLTPKAVQSQVKHLTNQEYESQHVYDAVGMGLWAKGLL
jgi:hypothetical protein